MLDLSGSPFMAYMLSFLVMGIPGIAMLVMLRLLKRGWIWLSFVLTLFVFFWILRLSRPYMTLRKLVGRPYMEGNKEHPAEPPANDKAVTEHIGTLGVRQSVLVGYVIPAIILWLMVFKLF